MRFIDYRKEIFGEIVQQTFRRLACRPAGQRTRIVLDAVAVSKFAHHLNVVLGTLPDALSLYVFLRPLEIPETFRKLILNALVRRLHLLLRHDELLGWSYDHSRHRHTRLASNRIKRADGIHFVSEELHAHTLHCICREDVDNIPAHTEIALHKLHVVTGILRLYETRNQVAASRIIPYLNPHSQIAILRRFTQSVDA